MVESICFHSMSVTINSEYTFHKGGILRVKLCYNGIILNGFADDDQEVVDNYVTITQELADTIKTNYNTWYMDTVALIPRQAPQNISLEYIKFDNGMFVEMTDVEKADVDAQQLLIYKQNTIKTLRAEVLIYISNSLSDSEYNRLKSYRELSKKVSANITLDTIEQSEYDTFPNIGETHSDCLIRVTTILEWVFSCLQYCKINCEYIDSATSKISTIIEYPPFPF